MSRGLAWDVGAWPVCVLQVSIHLMLPSVCCVIVRLKTGSWYDAAHPLRYSPNTSRFASRLVQAMPAWSVKTRRAPSRHCGDARVYDRSNRAMHDHEGSLWLSPSLPRQDPSSTCREHGSAWSPEVETEFPSPIADADTAEAATVVASLWADAIGGDLSLIHI